MLLNIYSIFDTAAAIYQRPFTAKSHGEVTRSFKDVCTDADHEIGKHPEDYTLFCLGTFNDGTGEVTGFGPEKVATALELVAATRQVNRDNIEDLHRNLKQGNDA